MNGAAPARSPGGAAGEVPPGIPRSGAAAPGPAWRWSHSSQARPGSPSAAHPYRDTESTGAPPAPGRAALKAGGRRAAGGARGRRERVGVGGGEPRYLRSGASRRVPRGPGRCPGGGAGEGGGGGWREPATAARDGARRAPAHVSAAAPSRRTPRAPAPRAGGREGAQTGPARPRPGVPRAAGERSRRRRVHGGGSGGDGGLRRHRLRSHPPTMHSLATAAVSARLRAPPSGGGTALGMGPHCAGRAGRGSAAASGCGGNLRLWGGGVPVGSVPSASPAGPVWELPNSGCSLGAAPCRQCGLCLLVAGLVQGLEGFSAG